MIMHIRTTCFSSTFISSPGGKALSVLINWSIIQSNKCKLMANVWLTYDSNQIHFFSLKTVWKGFCDSQRDQIAIQWKHFKKNLFVCCLAPGTFSLFLIIREILIRCKSSCYFPQSSNGTLLHLE